MLGLLALASAATAQDDPAALRRAAAAAADRAAGIARDMRRADRAADRALADAARVAARIQQAERRVAAAQARVASIERLRTAQRARLAAGRAPVARLLAALQTMARRPPALALVNPGATADLVHTRLALDTILPAITARTAALRAEIAEGDRLRGEAGRAVAARDAATRRLAEERTALVRLADAHRDRATHLSDRALGESDRALAFAADARDVRAVQQRGATDRARAAALARLPAPESRGGPSPPRAGPAWRLPVAGRLVTGFGALTEDGIRSRGLVLAPARAAAVVAPAAGRVAFAGPFRGYGTILILAHLDGWTTLIAGLSARAVDEGGMVAAGAPLGRAGPRVTIEVRRGELPVDAAALAVGG